jgi:hypothetical protein
MTSPAVRNDTQIDHVSSAAICEEVGDRLRTSLTGAHNGLPRHMTMLVEQIALTDGVGRPSRQKRNRSKPIKLAQPAANQPVMLHIKQNAEVAQ